MSKARRTSEQKFHDEFADMSIEDQAAALKILNYEHDQAKRRAEREERRPARSEGAPAVDEPYPQPSTTAI